MVAHLYEEDTEASTPSLPRLRDDSTGITIILSLREHGGMAYALHLKCSTERYEGSNPSVRTKRSGLVGMRGGLISHYNRVRFPDSAL